MNKIEKCIQEQRGLKDCYGCGPNNQNGLRIKSYWSGKIEDPATAEYKAKTFHQAASSEVVYGGILASLLDCHSVNQAIANHYHTEGREIGSGPEIVCVTAQLNIRYLAPAPITKLLKISSRILKHEGRKTTLKAEITENQLKLCEAEILAIRVKELP